jgi:hypothetical protein
MGLGMGLLQPLQQRWGHSRPRWTNAMQGYMQGAQADARRLSAAGAGARRRRMPPGADKFDAEPAGEGIHPHAGEGEFERLMRAQGIAPGTDSSKRQALCTQQD